MLHSSYYYREQIQDVLYYPINKTRATRTTTDSNKRDKTDNIIFINNYNNISPEPTTQLHVIIMIMQTIMSNKKIFEHQ